MLTDDKIKALAALCKRWDELDKERDDIAALCKRWDELDKERDDIKDKIERLVPPTPKCDRCGSVPATPNGAVIKMSPNETWQRNAQKVTP